MSETDLSKDVVRTIRTFLERLIRRSRAQQYMIGNTGAQRPGSSTDGLNSLHPPSTLHST